MKSLIDSNYDSIVKRGLIDWSTPIQAFIDKINEELRELQEAKDLGTFEDFKEELADIILTCLNTAKHFDIDIEDELHKKIQKNHDRARNNTSKA